jgi:hypothetical protein
MLRKTNYFLGKELNMKSRRVLTILLSMAIMLTFMPTMAFAAVPEDVDPDDGWTFHNFELVDTVDGINRYECTKDGCDAHFLQVADEFVPGPCEHVVDRNKNRMNLTAEEFADVVFEQYTEEEVGMTKAEFLEELMEEDFCYASVPICALCGKVMYENAVNKPHDDKNAVDCASEFECARCGQIVAKESTGEHNFEVINERKNVCGEFGEEGDEENGYHILDTKCTKCGFEDHVVESMIPDGEGGYKPASEAKNVKHFDPANPKGKPKTHKEEVVPATCTEDGLADVICDNCEQKIDEAVIKATGHSPYKVETPASCEERAKTEWFCANGCGDYQHDIEYHGKPLGHDYKVETVIPATCYQAGVAMISCTNDRCEHYNDVIFVTLDEAGETVVEPEDYEDTVGSDKDGLYFMGYNKELEGDKVKRIDPLEKSEHKWEACDEMIHDATCTEPALKAQKKCSICGDFDAHHAQEVGEPLGHELQTYTVAPTCGDRGFTYDTCTRCKQSVRNDEAADAAWVPTKILKGVEGVWAYDFEECVVAEGTPCQFEWVSENGEKVHKCKVCGAIDNSVPEEKVTPTPAPTPTPTPTPAPTPSPVVVKAENGLVAAANTVKAKSSKKKTIANYKAFVVSGATGAVTFAKTSGNSKIKVAADGKVTVKKGLKKGKTYKVYVNVTAAGDANTNAKTVPVLLKVKVK